MARAKKLGPSLGWQMSAWHDFFLCHGPGDLRGQPLETDAEMLAFTVRCYELDRQGKRVVDEALLSRCKGRAKTEQAGKIVCGELVGPCRFDHWAKPGEKTWWGYEFERGEPVGRPILDPFIRCLATEESQTGATYGNVVVMLEHLSEHFGNRFPKLDIGLTRVFLEGGGEIRPSTASSSAKDGGKETNSCADEPHHYVLPELREMYDMVMRNMTKRPGAEPWMLATSTMFQPGRDSTAERIHKRAKRGDDPALLLDHLEAPMPKDWADDDQLLFALKMAAGSGATWMDFRRRLRECRREAAEGGVTKAARYFLNSPQVDAESAVDPKRWAELARPTGPPPPGTAVALGFDGSESGDSTGLVGCEMESGRLFVVGVWEAPKAGGRPMPGWQVPRLAVRAALDGVFADLVVARMYPDPKGWRSEIADWQATWGDDVVVAYPTNSWRRWAQAVDGFLTGIRTGGTTHDGSADLAAHVGNARRMEVNPRKPEDGSILVKESPNSPLKIDLAVAATLAKRARDDALASGWVPPAPVNTVPLVAWR